jgi:hypothetical protein
MAFSRKNIQEDKMDRREEEEGISSIEGGRFVNPNGLPPVRTYKLEAVAAPVEALADSYGTITGLHWIDTSTGQTITEAAVGQSITLVADWTATCPTIGISWKACCTAIEALYSIPLTSAWKNYVQANTTGSNSSTKTNMRLNQMGASVMPARNLNVIVKLWVRGDLNEDYPALSEAWRN